MSISHKEQDSVYHIPPVAVVVATEDVRLVQEAEQLIKKLGDPPADPELLIHFGPSGVDIRSANTKNKKGYWVDFATIDRRTGAGNLSRKQVFPKSIGPSSTTVIDATAGFGADAAMLALIGYTVIAIERSPILSVLLRDGLSRAKKNKELRTALDGRLVLIEGNSLVSLQTTPRVDVVYLDPMFPPKRKKSALPQGSIQTLQSIVGYDPPDKTNTLFEQAMQTATKRVVVKRPNYAPFFSDNPVAVHKGKLVRYEVYKPNA